MNLNRINLLAISPYEGLSEILKNCSSKRNDLDLTIEIGDLNIALEITKEKIAKENYDAIISRGGTADLLRDNINLPVIEISISVYDVLRAIKMAESYHSSVAIAAFSSITEAAGTLCDLLNYDIKIVTFDSEEDVYPNLLNLRRDGYDLVLTDMIGSIVAEELDMNRILITSGFESVESSVDKAVQLVQSLSMVTMKKELFKRTILSDTDSIVILEEDGSIWFSSILKDELRNEITQLIHGNLNLLQKKKTTLEKIIAEYIVTFTNDLITYDDKVFTVVRIKSKKMKENQLDAYTIYNLSEEGMNSTISETNIANSIGKVREQLHKFSPTRYPLIIVGEIGTGKDNAASFIYKNGPYKENPFYTVDCTNIKATQWDALISDDESPFYNLDTTIHFKEVNNLENKQIEQLISLIENTNLANRNKLIFSVLNQNYQTNCEVIDHLIYAIDSLQITLNPLRERKEDISSIITLYINRLNIELGKQIIGLRPDALELIEAFSWPHNLNQLYRVIKELAILEESFISKDSVEYVLSKERSSTDFSKDNIGVGINLNQSFDDIRYDIIQKVLIEEDQNKEKTAQRLEISRSTLWRILKEHDEDE